MYLRQRCSDGSVNKIILKPRLAVAAAANTYTCDFSDVKFRVAALIRYRRKQSGAGIRTIISGSKVISSSMSRHLSTRNISSKYMHAFLSNLANRQTDRQTRANAFTSSFVGGNKWFTSDVSARNARRACDVFIHDANSWCLDTDGCCLLFALDR